MTHTDVYDHILEELAAGEMNELQRTIFAALRRAYPHGRTRRQLIQDCYGYTPAEEQDLNNSSHDRKIRAAIADMFEHGIPVIATSGEPGYRIDISEESIQAMISELRSRRARADEKIDAAEKLLTKVRIYGMNVIPVEIAPTHKFTQMTFIRGNQ